MALTQRQRRLQEKVVVGVLRRLQEFLESEEGQGRWFTRDHLEQRLGFREEDFGLGELDIAFARLTLLEGVEVRRKRVKGQFRYAWFPVNQLRLRPGVPDSEMRPSAPRPNLNRSNDD